MTGKISTSFNLDENSFQTLSKRLQKILPEFFPGAHSTKPELMKCQETLARLAGYKNSHEIQSIFRKTRNKKTQPSNQEFGQNDKSGKK